MVLSLFYFFRIIEPVTLRMRKYLHQNIKTQTLLVENKYFILPGV